VLIGGTGADLIGGNGADDILISGSTAFDFNLTALELIRAEWNSARTFADRVVNLSGNGTTGINGSVVLRAAGPGETVSDDATVDLLTGDAGDDWFLLNSTGSRCADRATDMTAFEGLFDLDL
jgi:Ca2+-binding RTX toxin-like protein